MTISYRMLGTIVAVVLLFGVGAAFVVDDDEDVEDASATTTVTAAPDDEDDDDDADDEEKDESTSTTRSSPTTSTTAAGATTSTTAASAGATTSTTRRPGSSTTTTRPPATTAPPQTSPPPTSPPPTTAPQQAADLLVHAQVGGDESVRRASLQVENAGPDAAADLRLVISGAGAPVRSVSPGSGFSCSDNGSTVTCTATNVGRGGRVREVAVEFGIAPGCAGAPALTATVSSSTTDPNPGNNSIVPRSLCPAAG